MKYTYFALVLLLCLMVKDAGAFNVTFRLDMTGVSGYTTPEVNGTFNGWCGNCNPMSDSNGDGIWEAVINLPAGYFEYKFSADNWSQQETLPVGASCTATTGAFTNRTLNVSANTVLPVVCWGSCSSCTNHQVTFQVSMASVSGFSTPYVSGNFNGWCGNCLPMTDSDGDQIWTATTTLLPGTYEYKFSYDNWAGAENLLPGSSCTMTTGSFTNRVITVSQTQTLPVVCWGSCESPGTTTGPQPSIQIAITSGTNPSCEDVELVFTATATNVTSAPVYQWQVNGVNVGANSATLNSVTLQNGDQVSCRLNGGAGCNSSVPVVSNIINVLREAPVVPGIVISSSTANPLCQGASVTFTAQPTNGGTAPVYQWKVNGQNVGTNSPTYTTSSLSNGQVVTCQMTSSAACVSAPWNLIWSDEFNGTSLDPTKWTPELGASGWGNNEWQNYTASSNNIQFGDGQLHIVARNDGPPGQQYSSARLITKNNFSFKYGRVSGRLQLPLGQGIWPAFWMLGANIDQVPWPSCGEIDIMEHINNETKIYGTTHWSNGGWTYNTGSIITPVTGFHEYTVEWDSLSVRFFMDGSQYHQHMINSANGSLDEFTKPFFLLLNVAVGGNWPGYPDANTVFPVQMDVDYVRVWQRNVAVGSSTAVSNSISVVVSQPQTWYRDLDGDGYGNLANSLAACTQPVGYVVGSADCNDASASVNPGVLESCTTAVDDNCNGQVNEGCCTGAPAVPTAISGPNGVCRNSTGNVFTTPAVAGATSYLWTLPTGATGTSTTNSITLSFGSTYTTGNLSVRAVGPCGTSATFTRSVAAYTAVPTSPTTITGPTVNVCAGSTQTFSCSAVATATSYQWTAPTNATIVSGQGTQTVSIAFASNFGASGSILVRSQNCFGLSSNRSLLVYNIPATPGTISGAANNVCPGTQSYSVVAVPGASSYLWTAPTNATITAGQGTNMVTVTYASAFVSGSLTVRAVSTCGQSAVRSLTVSKNPTTTAVITGQSSNLCGGGQFTYTIAAVNGAVTYNWTAPAGCTIASSNLNTATINVPSTFTTGTLSVACVNSCGGSITRTLALTRLPATPASITGPASVCPSQVGVNFTTPVVSGVTNTWTVPTGATITGGQNTASMTCTWGTAAGSVTVRGVNACGQSTTRTKALTLLTCMEEQEGGAVTLEADRLSVYPNPNQGEFVIESQWPGEFELLNAVGQVVNRFTLGEELGFSYEVRDLSAGVYFVRELHEHGGLKRVVVAQ